jgi:hypothetical protein
MSEYEIVNEKTGEIELIKTSVDIKQLEDYNQWKIDKMLNPPTYSPQEYALHIENEKNKEIIEMAKEYIKKYNSLGMPLPTEIIDRLEKILNGQE